MKHEPMVSIHSTSGYVAAQSLPEQNQFAFSYTIAIHNLNPFDIQLLHRYWLITDADGKKIEVEGEGVVGEKPVIATHQHYQYSSYVLLKTPVGTMQGFYDMKTSGNKRFRITIPVFRLAIANLIH